MEMPGKIILVIIVALAVILVSALALTYVGASTLKAAVSPSGPAAVSKMNMAPAGHVTENSVSTGDGWVRSSTFESDFAYSVKTVSPEDAASLQAEGVQTVVMPAGSQVRVTAQAGQPLSIEAVQGPNVITLNGEGPGSVQTYSFTGSPGQAFLATQQSDGFTERVLVTFQ